jgi:uracil-DNA glycosylase
MATVPTDWAEVLHDALASPTYAELQRFVAYERTIAEVYPPDDMVFAALAHTPFARVKVVLLGQDPYHGPGQAEGLCLSVAPGVALPPSLRNMLKELQADIGCPIPDNGSLVSWADQGVLLLNTVLTVRRGQPNSHQKKGWEAFTDAIIVALDAREEPVVFVLWGAHARKKARWITGTQHRVLVGVHPSPLSAHTGFFGSRPYSKIDEALREVGHPPMVWALPDRR